MYKNVGSCKIQLPFNHGHDGPPNLNSDIAFSKMCSTVTKIWFQYSGCCYQAPEQKVTDGKVEVITLKALVAIMTFNYGIFCHRWAQIQWTCRFCSS